MKAATTRLSLLALAMALSACAALEGDKIDYKSATKGSTLEVPPDLTQLSRDSRYNVPGGAVSAAAMQAGQAAQPSGTANAAALQLGDVRIERDGNQRWLVVNRPADKLWGPVREFWQVNWIDFEQYRFEFQGSDAVYRYWDATICVEFGFEMAKQALDVHLKEQVRYLENFDEIYRVVNDTYDVRQPVLNVLISSAMDSRGVVSQNKRKRFRDEVSDEAFDLIEAATKRQLRGASAISKGKGPSS